MRVSGAGPLPQAGVDAGSNAVADRRVLLASPPGVTDGGRRQKNSY